MSAPIVILLRRDPKTLTQAEMQAFQAKFGPTLSFVRTDPVDYREHLEHCQVHRVAAVLLPTEKPIPAAAMDAGFVHVVVMPDGTLAKLEPLIPKFSPL
jgi:hypothetical protein